MIVFAYLVLIFNYISLIILFWMLCAVVLNCTLPRIWPLCLIEHAKRALFSCKVSTWPYEHEPSNKPITSQRLLDLRKT